MAIGVQEARAQDDILDAIEAELKAEEEQKKAAEKAAKNAEKYQANYQASIRKADAYLRSKKFDDAIEEYEEAKKWGPLESYPAEQIELAKKEKVKQEAAEKQAKIEAEYKEALQVADELFNEKKYLESIPEYEKAKKINPEMAYPTDQIGEAKKLQAKLEEERAKAEAAKKLEEDYQKALDEGDDALKDEAYDKAIAAYEKAKKLKPTDQVPKARIKTAQDAKTAAAAKAAQAKLQEEFDAAMSKAEDLLKAESYDDAIAAFKEAQKIMPTNPDPKSKITEAENLKKQAAQAATQEKYQNLIDAADDLLKDSQFEAAKKKYSEASAVKPQETYPKTKIKECEELKVAAKKAELKEQYDALVKEADDLLEKEDFDLAKKKYEEALKILPHETHPKTMIAEADTRKKNKANQLVRAEYDKLIAEADALVKAEDFDQAVVKYNEAKKVIPNETHPGDMLIEIEKLKKQKAQAKVEEEYEKAMSKAEALMREEKFTEAIAGFEAAHKILPTENKTTELIAEAKKLIADKQHAASQAEFDAKVKTGEELLKENKFDEAIASFRAAAEILPNDNKAQFLIEEAQKGKKSFEESIALEQFNGLIKAGDAALESEDFVTARLKYNEALANYKPGKNEVDKKLAALDQKEKEKLNAEMAEAAEAEKKEKFEKLVAEANSKTGNNDFQGALSSINQALSVFPNNEEALTLKSELEGRIETAKKEAEASAEKEKLAQQKAAQAKQISDLVTQAKSDASQKQFTAALNKIEQALAIDASNPDAISAKTEVSAAQKAFELEKQENAAAEAEKEKALKEKQAQISTLLTQSSELIGTKKYSEATEVLNQVLELDPSNSSAQEKIAEIKSLKESERLASEQAEKLAAEKEQQALKQKQVADIMSLANKAYAANKYEEALTKYNEALAIDAENSTIQEKIRSTKNQIEKAQNEKLAAEKAEAEALAAQAAAAEKAKRSANISKLLEEASDLELARSLKAAKAKYTEVLTIDANNSTAQSKITSITNQLEQRSKEQAAEQAAKKAEQERLAALEASKALKQKVASQLGIGDQMMLNKNYKSAVSAYQEALDIDAENSLVKSKIAEAKKMVELEEQQRAKMNAQQKQEKISELLNEAKLLVVKQEYLQAKSKYEQVIEIESSNAAAQSGLEAIKGELGALEEAEALAEKRRAAELEKMKKVEQILDDGFDLFAGGKYDEAINKFKEGVDIDPTNQELKQGIHDALEQQNRLKMIMLAKKSNRPRPQPKFKTESIGKGDRTDKLKYQNELGKAYPEGVTETKKQENRKEITTRIVVRKNVGSEYKQIRYDWGGTYYFKNGESVGTYIWQYETRDELNN